MKLAVSYENGQIFQHFGNTEIFKLYDIENGEIMHSELVNAAGSGHGALAGFLKNSGVELLICGGIGAGAKNALAESGIKLYCGAKGNADDQVKAYLNGTLSYDLNFTCSHHGQNEEHNCGSHDCGGNSPYNIKL